MSETEPERWQPVPIPKGDPKHDIGDDVRTAIFHRLHDDFTLAAPWMTAEQRRQLAMLAAASVRALLSELGTLRDMEGVVSATAPERFTQTRDAHANDCIEARNRQLSEMAVERERLRERLETADDTLRLIDRDDVSEAVWGQIQAALASGSATAPGE